MEPMNLQDLSLLLDQDIVVIQEDVKKYQLKEKLKARHSPTELGENVAVEAEESQTNEEYREELLKVNYEGNFEKGVLIIYQGNHLEDRHREFLLKILGAVGCSFKDVALVSSKHVLELPYESIIQLNPHKLLVFGSINHELMQFKTADYECCGEETEYFFADDLGELAENVNLKRKLWNGLQVLFNINK